jgi:Transglutaminase-like superfamily
MCQVSRLAGSRAALPVVLRACGLLVQFEWYLKRSNFVGLHNKVHSYPCQKTLSANSSIEQICRAVDTAAIWYWKQVYCLQRSAATACLLRHHGFRAEMIIGAQHVPFRTHAWVEVEGLVVSDRPYMREIYEVLDRC